MEAEHSQPSDGAQSGGQQQTLSESSTGSRLPQIQEQATSQPIHGSRGRHQHRQPKRRDMLRRQQQQQSQVGESSWQVQDTPGPSGSSYFSSLLEPSTHPHSIPSHPSKEVREGSSSRRERKPQKPGKYVCPYCGRPCAKPSVLQKHIRSHTGERPYPCVPCGFSFKTKSNLYKHRKSHAHRIKADLASSREEYSFSGAESGTVGDEKEEATEADTTESEDETGQRRPKRSQERPALKKSSKVELSFSHESQRTEDSQAVKQRLAMRLSERKRLPMESPDQTPSSSLGPGSKGSTESGYFSSYGSAELSQVSPPNANVKTYAEIILGKYGRLGQQQRISHQQPQSSSSLGQEEKSISFPVPKTQVIEHITKLITINEAVVDTREIDSVKPRRSSLSRRSSIEAMKFSSSKDPCLFDPMGDVPGTSSISRPVSYRGSADEGHRTQSTEDMQASLYPGGVLSRSQSVPSSSGKDEFHSFRLSQSFDEQQAASAEMRIGHPHRMLRRQPAIEMPVGSDLVAEAGFSTSNVAEKEWKQQMELRLNTCEFCGACLKKQDDFEAHKKSCKKLLSKAHPSEKLPGAIQEGHRQMMHYKFKAMAMAIRKRRKEESLEEDPLSPGPAAISFTTFPDTGPKEDFHGFSGTVSQREPEKAGPYKEISVIQHTSSFEKQESISLESESEHKQSQEPKQTSTSRLVRQPKIQVPEILVTKEPDPETSSLTLNPTVLREPEKEFQWPQRSQSLSQLPAEKLPPKKKRLRLAEVQSSGESSFESVSLTRSPSQESNVSHNSSRSASFEESGKTDPEIHAGSWSSQGSHMLTVPGTHQHYFSHREMQRSASEQAPATPPHSAQIAETRSKSFDCGSLPSKSTSPSWKEKRKCLLVKHATLEKTEEPEESSSSRLRLSLSENIALQVDEHGACNVARYCPDSLAESLFQPPFSFSTTSYPLTNPETSPQMAEYLPITTAISKGFSGQIFHQALTPPVPSLLHSRQLHLAEQLGLPVQPFSAMLSLQYPASDPSIQDTSGPPIKDSTLSPSTYRSDALCHPFVAQHQPRPIIATCLEQLRPVVSLVVPVRLQTRIPTYANAMYTTISQILATTHSQQPVCCTAMVIMGRLEGSKFQQSYLRISPPCITLPLPLESGSEGVAGDDCWSLGAGGSKRMLSPAGSLELSLEAQRQQKRIKEEEKAEEIEDDFDKSSKKYLKESQETTKDEIKSIQKEDVVMVKEQESKVKKTESVETEIIKVKTGVKAEEKQEKGHRSVSLVEIPERSKDPMNFTLHTATSVSWCYLNYTKPNHSAHTNPQTSVYSSWSVSMYNPNLPGMSTKTVLSLLCSKQTYTSEMYTMATTSHLTTDKIAAIRKKSPKALEVHAKPPSTKVKDKEEQLDTKVEKEKRSTEEDPTTSKQSKPVRICIFEGGYKSNEDYVYVRGRGRGKYICGECGIRCKKPSMLKKHIRTHTDIRPYVCKHCNFAFKTKGNLTKHMKSKAHGKKCQAMGVSESSVDEPEADEPGTSEGYLCESEDTEEHQFSDIEDSEDDDDDDHEEEDEDLSSHGGPPSSCSTDTRQSESGQSSQIDPARVTVPESEERVSRTSPLRPWSAGRAASPDTKRMLFCRKAWEHSPLAFSPGSEGSPIQNLSPRLELSSPSRHLSPSPERGPSPLAGSPLRPLSPLRSLSPASFRSSRARLSSAPLRTQHRARSSPGHFHWEFSSQSKGGQQERPGTPSSVHSPQRLTPPHPSPVPAPLRFLFSDTPSCPPAMPRTTDCMFSHLPLHSQQQNRMPYHMIPIGGIQMVQLRPRSHPTLDRASSSTHSPTSRKEDLTFSLNKCPLSTSWSSQPETSQAVCEYTQSMKKGNFSLYSHATCSRPAYSSPAGEVQDTKPYGSSLPSKTHTAIPETSQELGQETSERAKTDLERTEKETKASSHRKSEHSVPEKRKEGQSITKDTAGQRTVESGRSQDSSSDST